MQDRHKISCVAPGQHRAVIEAAASASLDLIAYTSIIHADVNPISLAASHRDTERMIAATGLPYAILIGADAAMEHGALLGSTGDGTVSGATRTDYAEAAATVLTGEVLASRVYELAGDEAFTLSDIAAVLSEVADRSVAYQNLPEADYREALVGAGVPAAFVAALAEYSAKAAGGILADHTRTLSGLIGRPTETMRDVLLRALRQPAEAAGTSR